LDTRAYRICRVVAAEYWPKLPVRYNINLLNGDAGHVLLIQPEKLPERHPVQESDVNPDALMTATWAFPDSDEPGKALDSLRCRISYGKPAFTSPGNSLSVRS
jgi:hypothetical protein